MLHSPPAGLERHVDPVQVMGVSENFFQQADKCLDGECSITDVEDLLVQLRRTIR
jgi:hypothetical protein